MPPKPQRIRLYPRKKPCAKRNKSCASLLNRMHIDRLKALETEVIEAAKADPTQLAKYKDIVERRKKLEASLVPAN